LIFLITLFPIGPLKHVADISDHILRPLLKPCRWPDYFLLATLAGFCEELLFRGWLQPFLAQWMPLWGSILIGGFLFGLCHMLTTAYFILAWIISIYLALLMVWSDNLLVPMLTHGVYDLVALFVVLWPRENDMPISATLE
ncbi:MAG TPA: CPBP family intramembrane metalloprotease, partial [Gemmatales bacterium]|nr:CPBP family intramembrane metalloprotease [Gemmatales bacterium]